MIREYLTNLTNTNDDQGGGELRNCNFEDDFCSWTVDSELNRFNFLKNYSLIVQWSHIDIDLDFIDIDLNFIDIDFIFSTEAFVWNRAKGSEEDGQSGPMIDHDGGSDSE